MQSVRSLFHIDSDLLVPVFTERDPHVPDIDPALPLQPRRHPGHPAGFTTTAVMVQGLHGTGKSTHIEQVAARLNWPACASTSTATSAAWTWWARMPSCCASSSR
jgi:cobaltochelatase CobS